MKTYIGIDPGKSGGVAMLIGDTTLTLSLKDKTEGEIAKWLVENTMDCECFAILERVRSSPQMGVASAFTFGWVYGAMRGMLAGIGIPFDEVLPSAWQKSLGCLTGGDKKVSKDRAQQLYPDVKVTNYVADALLIAEYARRLKR